MLFLTTYNKFLAQQPAGLIEEVAAGLDKLPFRFTGKELDEETGLYYYGARYLDPKYSRWLSGDPALGEYIPSTAISNGVNNMINNTDVPLLEGLGENIKTNGAAGAISGFIQPPLKFTEKQVKQMVTVPDGYLYKHSVGRELMKDFINTARDEIIAGEIQHLMKE
ncbi:RHS repeat-associated protein [Treponema putidum]|nr:RHS repeat-associated core domain-containing protein [Treponema putidum]TWI78860.1 RHS repeat-associated protein [Treponema putidum]